MTAVVRTGLRCAGKDCGAQPRASISQKRPFLRPAATVRRSSSAAFRTLVHNQRLTSLTAAGCETVRGIAAPTGVHASLADGRRRSLWHSPSDHGLSARASASPRSGRSTVTRPCSGRCTDGLGAFPRLATGEAHRGRLDDHDGLSISWLLERATVSCRHRHSRYARVALDPQTSAS